MHAAPQIAPKAADPSEAPAPPLRFGRRIGEAFLTFWAIVVPFAWVGVTADPAAGASLRTALDDAIPFVPASVYLYSCVYTSMLYPLFTVRDEALWRRCLAAYGVVAALSVATYLVFPVTAVGLRPDVSGLDPSSFHNWGVRLTFFVDPATNLFPSLHVSVAFIATLAAWRARALYGWLALPGALGILVSISTMKQHFVADGLGALVVVGVAWRLTLASYPASRIPVGRRALTWRGPAAFAALHVLFYASFYTLFRAVGGGVWS